MHGPRHGYRSTAPPGNQPYHASVSHPIPTTNDHQPPSHSLIGRENTSQVRASTQPLERLRRNQRSKRRRSGDLGESNHDVGVRQWQLEIRVHDYRSKQHDRLDRGTRSYIVIADPSPHLRCSPPPTPTLVPRFPNPIPMSDQLRHLVLCAQESCAPFLQVASALLPGYIPRRLVE